MDCLHMLQVAPAGYGDLKCLYSNLFPEHFSPLGAAITGWGFVLIITGGTVALQSLHCNPKHGPQIPVGCSISYPTF